MEETWVKPILYFVEMAIDKFEIIERKGKLWMFLEH